MDSEKATVEHLEGEDKFAKSSTSNASKEDVHPVIDPEAERKLVRKLDYALLPLFTIIYCLNFIDRTAIGNARIAGLEQEIGMQGYDLNIALTVFYVFYIVSEVPSNLALKHFGSIWIAYLVIGFGAVAIGSAFMNSFETLLVTRVFLGLTEGGTLSGLVYLLARFYRRHELVLRIGIFFGLSPCLAGAFGGLLASGLLSIPDFGIVTAWRKIFLIEGVLTTAVGLFLLFFIPGDPTTTKLLNEEERAIAIARLDADQTVKMQGKKERTSLKLVIQSCNLHTIVCSLTFMMINISFQGLSLFLPTVVRTLGTFTTVEAQLRTVPPYLLGAIWAVGTCWVSFRMRQRWLPILWSVAPMVVGYSISVATKNPAARYVACFLNVGAGAPIGPLLLTWATDNSAPDTMRAMSTALVPGIGQIGSIIAVWTYVPRDAPDYRRGNSLNLATTCTTFLFIFLQGLYIMWENKHRDQGKRDHRVDSKTEQEEHELGYLHPKFRYQL
ncbi:unnamed protein product [Cyclocybe aegerita]|uniref:Major facilitator superfamily (MFS) profile domain-containing protein n=1 Tax=Cyclocybe aegerita TaxID=1973307 RepID=A0A8S0WAN1_CYCAE|nr:unnamed protein product [Cyclocybe aegerita]